MERIVPYLLCAVFLAFMYGLMRLLRYLSDLSARRSVYKSGVYTPKTVHTLLLSHFGSKDLLSNIYLPRKTENGTVYDAYDHVLLLNGALVIITVCREDGKITNTSFAETWNARIRTRSGIERDVPFENPIASGSRKIKALTALFETVGSPLPIVVEQIVIFPSRLVSFALPRQAQIMSPPEAVKYLKKRSSAPALTKAQRKTIKRILRRFSKSESQIDAKRSRIRHR